MAEPFISPYISNLPLKIEFPQSRRLEILGMVGVAVAVRNEKRGIMKTLTVLFSAVLACQGQQTNSAENGQISGTVKGDDGSNLGGATVFVRRTLAQGLRLRERTKWTITTDTSGVFQIGSLPNGQYTLCVQALSGNWLNPCEWGTVVPTVTVSDPQRSVSTTVVLKRGAAIPIRVDDPGQLLSLNEGKKNGAPLLVGVRSDALIFHAAPVASQDSGGRNYDVTIPFNAQVSLVVASSGFRLTDGAGKPFANNGAAAVPLVVPPTIHFVVT